MIIDRYGEVLWLNDFLLVCRKYNCLWLMFRGSGMVCGV